MIRQASKEVINQLKELLCQLSPEEYTAKLAVLNYGSIGQHVRHTIEFFQCLIKGISCGIVDYDGRERNLQIENNLLFTLNTLSEIEGKITNESNLHQPVNVRVTYNERDFQLVESNFMRELVYLVEHAIHHFALIRIGIQENFSHITLEPTFGVAYSTIRYQQELVAFQN